MKVINITENRQYVIALVIALFVTVILFYIDEGYYSFESFRKPGNYIPFVIYVAGIWFGQYVIARLLFRKQLGFDKTVLNAFLGVPLGLILTISFFILLRKLQGM